MTAPKVRAVEDRIQRLRQHIAQTQAQLRRERRKQRAREHAARSQHLLTYGALVALAALDQEDHTVVLGLLLEGASCMSDPATRQRWYRTGIQHLTKSPWRPQFAPQMPVRDAALTTNTREDTAEHASTLTPLELP